jgi:hypothetical protein
LGGLLKEKGINRIRIRIIISALLPSWEMSNAAVTSVVLFRWGKWIEKQV